MIDKRNKQEKNLKEENTKKSLNFESLESPVFTKIILLVILAAFLVLVYSRSNAKDVDLGNVETALIDKTNITETMNKQSDRDLMQFIGIDAGAYSQFIYYRNTTALAVDELLIVKCKDTDQVAAVKEAVEKRISSQIKAYEGYGPEQVKLLKNAAVKAKGVYYFYCTSDKAEKFEEVWLNAV